MSFLGLCQFLNLKNKYNGCFKVFNLKQPIIIKDFRTYQVVINVKYVWQLHSLVIQLLDYLMNVQLDLILPLELLWYKQSKIQIQDQLFLLLILWVKPKIYVQKLS